MDTLDVWAEKLPEFDQRASSAKYKAARGGDLDEGERAVWEKIRQLADRFHEADCIVVGVPMWNWAYPYKLKHLIDLVTQRGLLFEVDGDTIGPSLDVPLGIAFLVRGQAHPEWGGRRPAEFDHQSSYIEFWLRLIGVREVRTLIVEHTWDNLAGPAIEWVALKPARWPPTSEAPTGALPLEHRERFRTRCLRSLVLRQQPHEAAFLSGAVS